MGPLKPARPSGASGASGDGGEAGTRELGADRHAGGTYGASRAGTKPSASKAGASKPGASKTGASKTGASKTGASKTGASKAGASKTGASKAGPSKAGASKASASKQGRRLPALERRAQLIEVGRAVFAERGYEATSVEEIATRARVSKPIVYEHFGGKEGLYAVVVDREMDYVVRRIAEAIGSGTPRERVERASLAFLAYVRDHPNGFAVLSQDSPVTSTQGRMSSLLNDLAERVGHVFVRAFEDAGYDATSAPIYAHALVGMVTFVGRWWIEVRTPPIEEVAKHMSALAWMGLRHLPKDPALEVRTG